MSYWLSLVLFRPRVFVCVTVAPQLYDKIDTMNKLSAVPFCNGSGLQTALSWWFQYWENFKTWWSQARSSVPISKQIHLRTISNHLRERYPRKVRVTLNLKSAYRVGVIRFDGVMMQRRSSLRALIASMSSVSWLLLLLLLQRLSVMRNRTNHQGRHIYSN